MFHNKYKKKSMFGETWISYKSDFYPSLFSVAFDNSFTNNQFSQTVRESWKGWVFWLFAFAYSGIYFLKQLLRGVRETFIMPTGKADQSGSFSGKQPWVSHQQLIGTLALADPHFIRFFRAPLKISFRSSYFYIQSIFPSCRDLTYSDRSFVAIVKSQQYRSMVFRFDFYLLVIGFL